MLFRSLDGPAYREQLLANPEVFGVAPDAIAAGWVRVAADADDLLLGYALARPSDADDEAWDLDGLFVEPRVMGRGVGRALVQDVAGRARGTGAREVSVVANPQASGFYERLGFRAGDEVETRFGPARRMSRPV